MARPPRVPTQPSPPPASRGGMGPGAQVGHRRCSTGATERQKPPTPRFPHPRGRQRGGAGPEGTGCHGQGYPPPPPPLAQGPAAGLTGGTERQTPPSLVSFTPLLGPFLGEGTAFFGGARPFLGEGTRHMCGISRAVQRCHTCSRSSEISQVFTGVRSEAENVEAVDVKRRNGETLKRKMEKRLPFAGHDLGLELEGLQKSIYLGLSSHQRSASLKGDDYQSFAKKVEKPSYGKRKIPHPHWVQWWSVVAPSHFSQKCNTAILQGKKWESDRWGHPSLSSISTGRLIMHSSRLVRRRLSVLTSFEDAKIAEGIWCAKRDKKVVKSSNPQMVKLVLGHESFCRVSFMFWLRNVFSEWNEESEPKTCP